MKKILSVTLIVMLLILAMMISAFIFNVGATTTDDLTFTLNTDKNSYSLTSCSTTAKGRLTIPSSFNGKPVTSIDSWAFDSCTDLTDVYVPTNITSIGYAAFSGCSSLESITIPFIGEKFGEMSYPFGYIFGTYRYEGGVDINQFYTNSTIYVSDEYITYCIPSSLKRVTIIGGDIYYGAFSNCSVLTDVTIEQDVKSIREKAFSGCSGLKNITVKTVSNIESAAFSGCSSLESITIPFVGENKTGSSSEMHYPFGYIFGTTSYTGSTAAKQYFYYGDSSDTKTYRDYYIPNSLKSVTLTGSQTITNGAFRNCSNLTNIIIGDYNTEIGEQAFAGCTSLTSFYIPNSTTTIGAYAFYGCTSLTSFYIPNSTTTIGAYAFSGCTELKELTISDKITSIGEDAFRQCNISKLIFDSGTESVTSTIVVSKSSLQEVVIPDTVTSIENNAFSNCSSLSNITIPNSVTSIGDCAFSKCTNLTDIVIPNSVTDMGKSVFSCCRALTSMTLSFSGHIGELFGATEFSGSVKVSAIPPGDIIGYVYYMPASLRTVVFTGENLPNRAFLRCENLTSVILSEAVTSIGEYAFCGCTGLLSIPDAENVTSIGDYAFYGCTGLTSVSIPSKVTNIGAKSFSNCTNLYAATISDSVLTIDGWAFENCNKLSSVSIGENVTTIGYEAFINCTNLVKMTIPDSVTCIRQSAFGNCSKLTNVSIGNGLSYLGASVFYNCPMLQFNLYDNAKYLGNCENPYIILYSLTSNLNASYSIPNGVKFISSGAFKDCANLTAITMPNSVLGIGNLAFSGCSGLSNITVGNSLVTVGNSAFYNCSRLRSITIPKSLKQIDAGAFLNTNLKDIWYVGTVFDRYGITISNSNEIITNAKWHYNYCENSDTKVHIYDNTCDTECNVCRETRAITHMYEWIIDKENNCGVDGVKHRECSVCHDKLDENTVIDATGNHSLGTWYVYTEATFHTDGEERIECSVCDYYESWVIPKLSESHVCDFTGNEEIVSDATCAKEGSKRIYCYELECGMFETITIEKLGHTEGDWSIVTDATCTENGTKEQRCTVCNELLNTESIPSTGHQYGDWIVAKEPTTTESGEKSCECSVCHDVKTETIEPLEILGLLGDVNGDGKVNVKDATTIQKHLANLITITDEGLTLADADDSGTVNIKDATAIQKHVAGIETGFLIETPVSIKSATEDEVAFVDEKILLY